MDPLEINEDLRSKCCFCFKSSDFNSESQRNISGIVHDIYISCRKYIDSNYFTQDEFLNWCQPNPLPFCKKCLKWASKLNRMNEKLEQIQTQIEQLVNSFTTEFLKSRENPNLCSDDESEEDLQSPNNLKPNLGKFIKQERNDYFSDDNESAELFPFGAQNQEQNEDDHSPTVKMEFKTVKHGGKVQRGRKGKSEASITNSFKHELKNTQVNLRRMKFDPDGNAVPDDDLLPRRKAAVKAEESFVARNDNLDDLIDADEKEDISDNISEYEGSAPEERNSSAEETEPQSSEKSRLKRIQTTSSKSGRKSRKQFQCCECNKFYTRKRHLRDHLLTHDQSNRFKCTICEDVSFAYIKNFRQHMFKHQNNLLVKKTFKCQKCESTYKTSKELKEHNKESHKDMIYECLTCGVSYTYLKSLQQHSLEIHKVDLANKGENLSETNEKQEVDIRRYCNICQRQFSTRKALQRHERTIHGPQEKHYCKECSKEFHSARGLKEHMDRHNRDPNDKGVAKKFKCTLCDIVCSSRGNLNIHILTHSKVKRYECTLKCGKWFATTSNLNTHLIYHKGERAFLCAECGKSFFTKERLKNHTRIHTGLLHFCEYCGKGFQTTTHLKQHHRSHNKKGNDHVEIPTAPLPPPPPINEEIQLLHNSRFNMTVNEHLQFPVLQ